MDYLRSKATAGKYPLVIGHRGASGRLPENTLAAFRGAFDDGADGVELDVRLSSDGVPVVVHDATTTRTTGVKWRVGDRTSGELAEMIARNRASRRRVVVGLMPSRMSSGLGVPTLADALVLATSRCGVVYIELKGTRAALPELEKAVVSVLQTHRCFDRVVVLAFNHAAIRRVKHLDSRIRTAATVAPTIGAPRPSPDRLVAMVEHAHADEAALHVSLATKRRIAALHEDGKSVAVWTVNSPLVARLLTRFGVDALMTDYPDRFAQKTTP